MKDNPEVIECLPQERSAGHPIEQLRRENARAWALVWRITGLAVAAALMAGLATGMLIATM